MDELDGWMDWMDGWIGGVIGCRERVSMVLRRLRDDGAMSVRYVLVPVGVKVDRQERAIRRRC